MLQLPHDPVPLHPVAIGVRSGGHETSSFSRLPCHSKTKTAIFLVVSDCNSM
jgi:hypothetical protein